MDLDLDQLGVGKPHTLLAHRQLDVDPLTQVFNWIIKPTDAEHCWDVPLSRIKVGQYRHFLLVQLNGANFQRNKKIRAGCKNTRCINPWHAKRVGEPERLNHRPVVVQYPEIQDRERLLLWYAAGNSPVKALDVDDVKRILAAAPTPVRAHKGRSKVSRRQSGKSSGWNNR